jgi:hypothetical protein
MATHDHVVDNDHTVTQHTVMGDMRIGHDEHILTNTRDPSPCSRSPVNGHMLTHNRTGTDLAPGGFAFVFEILRRHTHRAERKVARMRTQMGMPIHNNVGDQLHPVIKNCIWPNRAPRTNNHALPKLCPRGNQSRWMNKRLPGFLYSVHHFSSLYSA